jgi:hypothetical protein
MAELADLQRFRATVSDPEAHLVARARADLKRSIGGAAVAVPRWRGRRVRLLVAIVALVVTGTGLGIAESGVLDGPPAPPVQDAALQRLFPPFGIGHAATLASYGGRSLFGARTASGGYCLSATSPTDPDAGGGHCLSDGYAARLTAGEPISLVLSGWSAAGFAPGARLVRLHGLGVDATVPVASNGWWIGVAEVHPFALPGGATSGEVTATALAADGSTLATTTVFRVTAVPGVKGVASIVSDPTGKLTAGP